MTHDVNTFAASLVEMALATKRVPELEADLADTRQALSRAVDTIQRLELKLMDRASEITRHLSTIRDLEVARDDAELRFLEADDTRATVVRTLRGIMGEAHSAIEAVEPTPVPPPIVQDSPIPLVDGPLSPLPESSLTSSTASESFTESQASPGDTSGADPLPDGVAAPATATSATPSAEGESAAGPTASSTAAFQSDTAPTTSAASTGTADTSTSAIEEVAVPNPFAASSSGAESTTVGEAAAPSASAASPTSPASPRPTEDSEWPRFSQASHHSA